MIPKKMKAVVMTGVGNVELHEYDVPTPDCDQVLVQTKAASICTVDQRPYRGLTPTAFPRVGGHEGSGVVAAVGANVKNFKVGDRVAIMYDHCGVCKNCVLGIGRCLNRTFRSGKTPTMEEPAQMTGSFAQYVLRKEGGIKKIADTTSFEHAAITEPLSDVIRSVRRSRLSYGETCVVVGAGIMGLLHTQMARSVGARVIVSEVDPVRRENAAKAGADIVINPQEVDPVAYVMDLTGGRGVDVVFYAIAISKFFDQHLKMLCGEGRIMIYSNQVPDDPYSLKLGDLHHENKEIIGTVGYAEKDVIRALEMVAFGKVKMDLVISQTFPITQCKEAFEASIVPLTYRVVIKMDEE